jgi:ribosomal protein L5
MNIFRNYYKQIIKQDFVNKFRSKKVPKLEKIVLNFGCRNFSIQKFATTMLALEIITGKKGTVTTSKKPNILLKIQKGQPSGCKVVLRKKEVDSFLLRLNMEILPRLKTFSKFKVATQQSNFFCQLPANSLKLEEFENQYPLFAVLPILDINMFTDSKNHKKILFAAKSVKLPI